MPDAVRMGEKTYRGIAVSAGVCNGKILVLCQPQHRISKYDLPETELSKQVERLEQALVETRKQILAVQHQVSQAMGAADASIFEAHLMVLEDNTLMEEVVRLMTSEKVNVEYAFHTIADKYIATLSSIEDEYLRERAKDMRDVTSRILNNLTGRTTEIDYSQLPEPCILVSDDLSPSSTAQLDKTKVLGFATDTGSLTSHTAILARSLQLPAVVGLREASRYLKSGQYVLLDGFNGLLVLNPTDQTLFEYGQLSRKKVALQQRLMDVRDKPAITLDGVNITLSANIAHPEDTDAVLSGGAQGVGLFRTEYLFLHRDSLPGEEEQYQAYRQVAQALKPNPVIIRTLDLGGDKFLSHLQLPREMNPFLGWRAIRFCLQEKEIFRAQLRAILRASVEGNVKILYPMISGVEELRQANALLEEYRSELQTEGLPFDPGMETGAMIEIPSAVMVADQLAKQVQFFSIGTNDLIQYALAVDRMNEKIAHLYEPAHPAIIRLIQLTVDAAHRNGIWVGICGEMAADPLMVPLLLGLGIDEMSAAAPMVPQIKYLIRRLRMSEAKQLSDFALNGDSPTHILDCAKALVQQVAPNLLEPLN